MPVKHVKISLNLTKDRVYILFSLNKSPEKCKISDQISNLLFVAKKINKKTNFYEENEYKYMFIVSSTNCPAKVKTVKIGKCFPQWKHRELKPLGGTPPS